jgi:hypothetical protein
MDRSALALFNSTRLVRLLSNLSNSDIKITQTHFADRFGQMFHFSSAITLSRALENASGKGFKPSGMPGNDIRNAFLSVQTDLVRFIASGFVASSRRLDGQLPTAESLYAHCELTGGFSAKHKGKSRKHATVYEPYRKFYISRQNDLDIKIQYLRSEIRDTISGLSPELAHLARIDKALSDSISEASLKIFAVVPKLLEKRFYHLFDIHRLEFSENFEVTDFELWMKPGGWISTFCIEIRELLLAELEVRLQPVVGMIDSIPQTTANGITDERKKQHVG